MTLVIKEISLKVDDGGGFEVADEEIKDVLDEVEYIFVVLVEVDSISVVLVELLNDRAIGIDIPADIIITAAIRPKIKHFFLKLNRFLRYLVVDWAN